MCSHVSAGNWTWFLFKSRMCSSWLRHFSNPHTNNFCVKAFLRIESPYPPSLLPLLFPTQFLPVFLKILQRRFLCGGELAGPWEYLLFSRSTQVGSPTLFRQLVTIYHPAPEGPSASGLMGAYPHTEFFKAFRGGWSGGGAGGGVETSVNDSGEWGWCLIVGRSPVWGQVTECGVVKYWAKAKCFWMYN